MRINKEQLEKAAAFLCDIDKDLALVIEREQTCRLQIKNETSIYHALLKAIAGQQLHAKAAEAILSRLKSYNDGELPTPEQLLSHDELKLRACGFSSRKITSLYHLSQATIKGMVPTYDQAQLLSDQELIDLLTQLPGIGPWTVEMVLIFTLGRLDVMPINDFGIREGWKICKGLTTQPTPKQLKELTRCWSPYRSVGAWYLWRAAEQKKPVNKQNPLTL
ncbi:DNA-3-methyladenine glycosylase family protein [Commensalibacter oyaizuii]|uniref:DNA-3-methyladenine glycosylase II n=1 Tax=Commensalibacter oyaizuii TaxID=3043873 RepID=A0ABT6PZH7_9PROT|nr:DNA-3-methyladenine glycosylase [Commensalibacter sp. TBRC 16381]MDI2089906.1 DNA-3-methyladenine glycosylase [Commensalibacter sp. TBRC 16381]